MASCSGCGRAMDEAGRCPECEGRFRAEAASDPDELVAVLRTADSNLLPVVKSVLDAAQIPYIVQGDEAMGMLPLGPFGGGIFRDVLGATVLVPRERADEALALLESFDSPEENP